MSQVKFRVTYEVMGKTMACEYKNGEEADWQAEDIRGYAGVTNCKVEGPLINQAPVKAGPFEVTGPLSSWERLDVKPE